MTAVGAKLLPPPENFGSTYMWVKDAERAGLEPLIPEASPGGRLHKSMHDEIKVGNH